jgi:hypothetical protein
MSLPSLRHPLPRGLAFDIPDLLALQRWAEDQAMRMVVELDHWVEGDGEYEEVLAFYDGDSPRLRRWIMWRAADHYVVEPMNSRSWRAGAVSEVLAELLALRS